MAIFDMSGGNTGSAFAPPPPPSPTGGGSTSPTPTDSGASIAYGGAPSGQMSSWLGAFMGQGAPPPTATSANATGTVLTPGPVYGTTPGMGMPPLVPTGVPPPPAPPSPTNAAPPAGIAPGSTWVSTTQPGTMQSQLLSATPMPYYDQGGNVLGYTFGPGSGGYWASPAQQSGGAVPSPAYTPPTNQSGGIAPPSPAAPSNQSGGPAPSPSYTPTPNQSAGGTTSPGPSPGLTSNPWNYWQPPTGYVPPTITPAVPAGAPAAPAVPTAPATDPSMSQGIAPWAQSWNSGSVLPSFVNQPNAPLPSMQQWLNYNPTEQQAILSAAQSMGIPSQDFLQYLQASAPEWGQPQAAQYVAV